ncbi:hypothetical protein MUK42_06953 [Musa troglodytarum]|nr:hypothetical protein MUK42_06953 [Musa troglodytarum]
MGEHGVRELPIRSPELRPPSTSTEATGGSPKGNFTSSCDSSAKFAAPPASAKSFMALGGRDAPSGLPSPPSPRPAYDELLETGHGAAAITTQLHAPPITILLSHLLLDHTLRPRKVFDMWSFDGGYKINGVPVMQMPIGVVGGRARNALDDTLNFLRRRTTKEPDGADTVAITFNDPNALVMAKFETWQTVQRKRNDQITSISYALRSETKVEADDCKFPLFHMV